MKKRILNYKINLLGLLFVTLTFATKAQPNQPFGNFSFDERVQTILLHPVDEVLSEPVSLLEELENSLQLSFDVLTEAADLYNYTFIHCTHDWKPSNLHKNEYIDGYEYDRIDSYTFSRNTLTAYVHYDLVFPTSNMMPRLSGNYLLVVFGDDDSPENILFTRRFMILDSKAGITANVPRYPKELKYADTKQQVDVTINYSSVYMLNPQQTFNVVIRQNGRWDNAAIGLKATYVRTNELLFENNPMTLFDAGNQFRNFDISDFRYQSDKVKRATKDVNYWLVELWPNKKRANLPFVNEPGLNGNKSIRMQSDYDPAYEGDYAWVEFFLEWDTPLLGDDVYIIGALNDWNIDERNRMSYSSTRRGYEGMLFLKQGYYNFNYAVVPRGTTKVDVGFVEGDFWDTENIYSIYVYFQEPGTSYEQLIGMSSIGAH
ncbi:MAG: DUF5103 domain-containing protein [Lentimicrobiaceae bacterium]|nr:DUF5103 domain-containing protein [Lentimicrobiaceae bacterium]